MADRVILTIGTKKGVFVAEAAKPRRSFALRGPFGSGVPVYSTLVDTRGTPRLYASSCNPFFGMKVLRSTDMGKSFKETKSAPAFPKEDGRALINIWSLEAGSGKKDLWCGVEPASLFRSHDGGDSWDMVPGISNHEHARKWSPGNGGLCMHTIIRDGNRVHLGISTGGHYLSEDGGETFRASNQGVGAGFAPDPYPEFGQCVHKIARHDDAPGRLYMQNHGGWADWTGPGGPRPDIGVLRSDDHGHSWRSIAKGLPRTSDSPSSSTRTTPTRCTSCPSSRRRAHVPGVRPRCGGARMAATRGAGSRACRRSRATSPSCATRWTSTGSRHPRFTSERRPVSSGSGERAVSSGTACSIRCHRSTTSRSPSCSVGCRGATQPHAQQNLSSRMTVHLMFILEPTAAFCI